MPYMAPCAMDSLAMEGAVHSHSDFRVRRSVVHRALNWLVTHNQYCRSNHVHIDVNPLQQLPHDGNLSTSLRSLLRTPSLNLLPPTLLQLAIYDRAGGSASVCSGATIKPIHLIIACHHDVASIRGIPINEFTTEGYPPAATCH